MSLEKAVKNIIIRLVGMRLGNPVELDVVKMYFVDGVRPTDIVYVNGSVKSKYMIRGYIQRLIDSTRYDVPMYMAYNLIKSVVEATYNELLKYEPVVKELGGNKVVCMLCSNKPLYKMRFTKSYVLIHLHKKHRNYLERVASEVYERVRYRIRTAPITA